VSDLIALAQRIHDAEGALHKAEENFGLAAKAYEKADLDLDAAKELLREAAIEYAIVVAEARKEFKSKIEFGVWYDTQNFARNENDRSAAVGLGKKPDLLRSIMIAEGLTSLQTIWRRHRDRFDTEARFSRPQPPAKPADIAHEDTLSEGPEGRPCRPQPPTRTATLHEETMTDQSSLPLPKPDQKPMSYEDLDTAIAALPTHVAAKSKAIVQRYRERLEKQLADETRRLMNERQRLERDREKILKDNEKVIRVEVERRVQARIDEWLSSYIVQDYNKKIKHAEACMNAYKGVMSPGLYTAFIAVCHPDNSASEETRRKVFQWLIENKPRLVKPERPVDWTSDLPKNRQEFEARAAAKAAQRSK
jgi:hypothetical protein